MTTQEPVIMKNRLNQFFVLLEDGLYLDVYKNRIYSTVRSVEYASRFKSKEDALKALDRYQKSIDLKPA